MKPRRGRPFEKGHARVGGRKPGVPNKSTVEIRTVARNLLENAAYQRALVERLRKGRAERIEALLYHYAYGVPKQSIDLGVTNLADLIVAARKKS